MQSYVTLTFSLLSLLYTEHVPSELSEAPLQAAQVHSFSVPLPDASVNWYSVFRMYSLSTRNTQLYLRFMRLQTQCILALRTKMNMIFDL